MPVFFRVAVVLFLFVEASIFIYFYGKSSKRHFKKLLIMIETVSLAFVLVFTGGLDSPFVWYALNPVLLSATLLPAYYCWLVMTTFLFFAVFSQQYSFYTPAKVLPLWPDRSSFFVIFFLCTFAAQIFTNFITRFSRQTEVTEKQLQHIKALYGAIEAFSNYNDPHGIANLFASYSRALTDAKKVIVWLETQTGIKDPLKKNFYVVRGPRDVLAEENWYPYIKHIFENRQAGPEIDVYKLPAGENKVAGTLLTVKIRSSSNAFGVLSAYCLNNLENIEEIKQTLSFLADLCAGALEKRYFESLTEEFLLMEEKDRIAGEIHDSVMQNIFGLVYSLEALIKEESFSEKICEQLRLMQKTAQKSLKDLRASIYCMSSVKNKNDTFENEIGKYLYDLGRLNNITVNFNPAGNLGSLGLLAKKSLYRIVQEATGNAIRHGQCDHIQVTLAADQNYFSLIITDNGAGFDPAFVKRRDQCGLGLVNMKELAQNIGGKLVIESKPGKGTVVSCIVPLPGYKKTTTEKERLNV